MRAVASDTRPGLILCPFLKAKVPADIWQRWTTIIIHPGPVGDRGPSSLDWAITEAEAHWGVTALQAVEKMDAGPIWATRVFDLPKNPMRKSAVYNGPVADAAMECVEEVLIKIEDRSFTPTPLARAERQVPSARLRPTMTQDERSFGWEEPAEHIFRRIRAADGSPGVRTELMGIPLYAFDVDPGRPEDLDDHRGSHPGQVLCRRDGAIHVRAGKGSLWIGHLRAAPTPGNEKPIKLPASRVLRGHLNGVPRLQPGHQARRDVRYRRKDDIGWLTFDFYNGAMSTQHCRRLLTAIRHALSQDTKALVIQGSLETFSNGIHLNVIEAADNPAREAWDNIKAMNAACKQIIEARTDSTKTVISVFNGSAGAGGVMLGLGADLVAAREGVVLNPYYDIGLYGSELHTYTLPRRVGPEAARRLLDERRPVDTDQAVSMGLVDAVGPRAPDAFESWLGDLARYHAGADTKSSSVSNCKQDPPLDAIEIRELAEMSHDMFDDRSGFAAARKAFVHKLPKERVLVEAQ